MDKTFGKKMKVLASSSMYEARRTSENVKYYQAHIYRIFFWVGVKDKKWKEK